MWLIIFLLILTTVSFFSVKLYIIYLCRYFIVNKNSKYLFMKKFFPVCAFLQPDLRVGAKHQGCILSLTNKQ